MNQRQMHRAILSFVFTCTLLGAASLFAADSDANPDAPEIGHKKLTPDEALRIRILESQAGLRTGIAKAPQSETVIGPNLDDREKVIQALNRMSFGPRPGEIDQILNSGGWEAWARMQLNPDAIDD
jgi:hypothetical protein